MLWGYEIQDNHLKQQALNNATAIGLASRGDAFLTELVDSTCIANVSKQGSTNTSSRFLKSVAKSDQFFASILIRHWDQIERHVFVDPTDLQQYSELKKYHDRLREKLLSSSPNFYLPCNKLSDGAFEAVVIPKSAGTIFEALCQAINVDRGDCGHFVRENFLREICEFAEAYPNLRDPIQKLSEMKAHNPNRISFGTMKVHELPKFMGLQSHYRVPRFEAEDAANRNIIARAQSKEDVLEMAAIYYLAKSGEAWPFAISDESDSDKMPEADYYSDISGVRSPPEQHIEENESKEHDNETTDGGSSWSDYCLLM